MHRIALAFRSFFGLLFKGVLPDDLIGELGLIRKPETPAKAAAVKPERARATASDGALQILGILQRDARLVDFLMEDIGAYSDEQVGTAVRALHGQCRETLDRYLNLQPVIDGVEGTFAKPPSSDPGLVKFLGNVPAVMPAGGLLRHRGWRAASVQLPPLNARQDVTVLAPAEIEVE
ncbi:MAG: DUF2760 domain-containing protein [Acidobacteriota bacterium]|nr:DUF2760 domain-containing protein [Acidobacteriota bacterium]